LTVRRVFVDPAAPQRDAIEEAAARVLEGGVVAIPTDTLYGLAADPFSIAAVARVFAVKGRRAERALPLLAADLAQVTAQLGRLSEAGRQLADRYWPGPLTLLLEAPRRLAPQVHGGTGTVGVRVPRHDVARAICWAAGRPITATSANESGAPPTADPDIVERTLGDRLDLLIDAGVTAGGLPSTIVDATTTPPALVRAGIIPWDEIQGWLHSARAAREGLPTANVPRSSD
jgi:L-threonylcarbamoyladenylate synthase